MTAAPSSPASTAPSLIDEAIKLAANTDEVAKKFDYWVPIRIVAIIVVALLLRWILAKAIKAFVRRTTKVDLKPRLAGTRSGRLLLNSAPLLAERHNQRVRAIGTALRSFLSFLIGMGALLLILKQFDVKFLNTPALAGTGIAAAALAFGAQSLIRDFLTGAFLIVEDQYGIGDNIDVGTVSGTVEEVGLRITQIRDINGVVWYVRNGEIVRVGNRSQGWMTTTIEVPIPFHAVLDTYLETLSAVALELAQDPAWAPDILTEPTVTGPDGLTADSLLLKVNLRTPFGDGDAVAREYRIRLRDALTAKKLALAAAVQVPQTP